MDTVEFSIPWNWHQLEPGRFRFHRPHQPPARLGGLHQDPAKARIARLGETAAAGGRMAEQRVARPARRIRAPRKDVWLKQLDDLLAPANRETRRPHRIRGGPRIDHRSGASALARGYHLRHRFSGADAQPRDPGRPARGALLWVNVEARALSRRLGAGCRLAAPPGRGGFERPGTHRHHRPAPRCRSAAQLVPLPRVAPTDLPSRNRRFSKLPDGVRLTELVSAPASAVSVLNRGKTAFHDDLLVRDPVTRRPLVIPAVSVPAGDSLWLPLERLARARTVCAANAPIFPPPSASSTPPPNSSPSSSKTAFSPWSSPRPSRREVVLQLAREPVGPYLAAGKPTKFDWDEKTLRAHLTIPAGKAAGQSRARRTGHRSAGDFGVLQRRAPPHRSARRIWSRRSTPRRRSPAARGCACRRASPRSPSSKSPNEIDYTIGVPADAAAWGFRAAGARSRWRAARPRTRAAFPAGLHPADSRRCRYTSARSRVWPSSRPRLRSKPGAGRNLEIVIRNNSPQIQTYRLEAKGKAWISCPPKPRSASGHWTSGRFPCECSASTAPPACATGACT